MSKHRGNRPRRNRSVWILALVTLVVFAVAIVRFAIIPVGQSKQLEQALIDRYGWTGNYTPPPDGHIPADRVEAFIRVREAVQDNCVVFQRILDDILKLEAIEEGGDLPVDENASSTMDSFGSMFSAFPKLLEFMDARNSALLAQEMGLGEYFYIYLAAYGEQLAGDADSPYAEFEEASMSTRSRDEFIAILRNQLEALAAAEQQAGSDELAITLKTEVAALEDGTQPTPWPGGPAMQLRQSLAPFQEQISALYCSGIVRTELMQKNRGLNFEG